MLADIGDDRIKLFRDGKIQRPGAGGTAQLEWMRSTVCASFLCCGLSRRTFTPSCASASRR
ncbi:hypothetical protein LNP26_27620 [Klebsiella variicola subsp. variicola]|nr:hypothetical protein [Klebsiella variicola subsp. variicola]